ncbi:MAG: hypothetical protein M1820_001478 [Bogoriella megaspora]|nr:MAG: hypothetical protein M1820_001478 [Bogoriella megaspora]
MEQNSRQFSSSSQNSATPEERDRYAALILASSPLLIQDPDGSRGTSNSNPERKKQSGLNFRNVNPPKTQNTIPATTSFSAPMANPSSSTPDLSSRPVAGSSTTPSSVPPNSQRKMDPAPSIIGNYSPGTSIAGGRYNEQSYNRGWGERPS